MTSGGPADNAGVDEVAIIQWFSQDAGVLSVNDGAMSNKEMFSYLCGSKAR